jgi:hypothetical protein
MRKVSKAKSLFFVNLKMMKNNKTGMKEFKTAKGNLAKKTIFSGAIFQPKALK